MKSQNNEQKIIRDHQLSIPTEYPIYHMTRPKDWNSIKEDGHIKPQSISGYSPRQVLDESMDRIGQDVYGNEWGNRANSVYFWPTLQQTIEYTIGSPGFERHGTILVASPDKINQPIWKINHSKLREIYLTIRHNHIGELDESHELWSKIYTLVQDAEQYKPENDDDNVTWELWVEGPLQTDKIVTAETINMNVYNE